MSVVHGGGEGTRPLAFRLRVPVGETLQRPRGQARRSTSYTVCRLSRNSRAMTATFRCSAFIDRIIVATVGVTFWGMPFGRPSLFTGGGVPPALMIASILAAFAARPAAIRSARTSVSYDATEADTLAISRPAAVARSMPS